MARNLVFLASLLFFGLLAFLTLTVLIEDGPSILVIVSLVLIAVLGFGVLGALTTPPDD
jgi:hypothetical protein